MDHLVIAVSRTSGCGGLAVGRALAEKMGVEYYDSKLLRMASEDSGISEQLFANADEKVKRSLLSKIKKKLHPGEVLPPESSDFTSSQNLFNYQAKVIREIAANSSCVIVGRCAEYVLAEHPKMFSVFVTGSRRKCAERYAHDHAVSVKEAIARTEEVNKFRADYHEYYTGRDWGDPANYDLCISTDHMSVDACAKVILTAAKVKFGEEDAE
ncbi:MAG: cytidylate kinase-like family protein [Clostridia bacterium]|nr:cytidylate kinase-like family protein [Clostridia bacterium]